MHTTTPDYTLTTVAGDRLVPGTVFTFTEDLTQVTPMWRNRIPGAHLVVTGYSSSGYCVLVFNTYTGRADQLMAEPWWTKSIRLISQTDPTTGDDEE
jgi:hypothetical protein